MQYIAMERNNSFFLLQCTMKGELLMNQEIATQIEKLRRSVNVIVKNNDSVIKRKRNIEKDNFGMTFSEFLYQAAETLALYGASEVIVSKVRDYAAQAARTSVMEANIGPANALADAIKSASSRVATTDTLALPGPVATGPGTVIEMGGPIATDTLALPGPVATGSGTVIEMGGPIAESTALTTTGAGAAETTALTTTGATSAEAAAGGVAFGSLGTIVAGALAVVGGLVLGYEVGDKIITPIRLYYSQTKELEKTARKLLDNTAAVQQVLSRSRLKINDAIVEMNSALKKLETEEYKGINKRRKKIQKRISELTSISNEIDYMNKAVYSVYTTTQKWLS